MKDGHFDAVTNGLGWIIATLVGCQIHIHFFLITGYGDDVIILNLFLMVVWTIISFMIPYLILEYYLEYKKKKNKKIDKLKKK